MTAATAPNFEIVKRTELRDVVILTIRRANPFLVRPFETFTVTPTSRYAQRLTDFASEAAALHKHEVLARNRNLLPWWGGSACAGIAG